MTDLVQRLRDPLIWPDTAVLTREAADTIEQLNAKLKYAVTGYKEAADEIERLEAALTDLRKRSVEEGIHHFVTRIDTALAAGKRHD